MTPATTDSATRPSRCCSPRNVNTYYGRIHALQGIDLTVDQGEIVTLLGSNGAGKTTTLKTISGLLHPKVGTVTFEGQDISKTGRTPLVRVGIGHAPEGPPHLLAHDRDGEPPDGWLHADRRGARRGHGEGA